MYLAIDVGGSKTLVAVFSETGERVAEHKFPTNHDYAQFLDDISREIQVLNSYQFEVACAAVPGIVNRETGVAKNFGNLPWQNVPVGPDIAARLGKTVFLENDCNLAALSEAVLVADKYKRVLYITLSTGIGGKLIINGKISPDVADAEVGFMIFNHEGRLTEWEEFASGQALVNRYGKKASEIDDPNIWQTYSADVATGLYQLITVYYPEVVVIGGGVGAHFEKFADFLNQSIAAYKSRMVEMPPIIKAARPEEAVIYGCYEYIKQYA